MTALQMKAAATRGSPVHEILEGIAWGDGRRTAQSWRPVTSPRGGTRTVMRPSKEHINTYSRISSYYRSCVQL
ncbi:hypothetical protein MRX96_017865 [Rhipicephalus microplus]